MLTTWPAPNCIIFFCDIVVPMVVSIPTKFYCLLDTRFWLTDFQILGVAHFWGTSWLRKSGMTSALIEIWSSFCACGWLPCCYVAMAASIHSTIPSFSCHVTKPALCLSCDLQSISDNLFFPWLQWMPRTFWFRKYCNVNCISEHTNSLSLTT
jgi:hypothetical protein